MKLIINELKTHYVTNIDDYTPFPRPFEGSGVIKAIILGMDPSTDSKIRFDTVFDLTGKDPRYFASIQRNLNSIKLSRENIYVQNFCQNYFTKTTYKQKDNWWRASAIWWHFLKEELDAKFDLEVPLLVTSELIFHRMGYLINKKNSYYYTNPESIPLQSSFVTSGRMLIPFYRHWKYNLDRPEWQSYKSRLISLFIDQ